MSGPDVPRSNGLDPPPAIVDPFAAVQLAALERSVADAVRRLAGEVASLRAQLRRRPELVQGKVTAVNAGPPVTVDVLVGEAAYPAVKIASWYQSGSFVAATNDGVWLLVLPGGRLICLGDLA